MTSSYRDDDEEYIPPIIERVQNIGGSTATPGTGELHKYITIRRKEILAELMQEKEEKNKKIQEEFERNKKKKNNILEKQTLKRKRKRERKKLLQKMYKQNKNKCDNGDEDKK